MKKRFLICIVAIIAVSAIAQESNYDQIWNEKVVKRIDSNIEQHRKGNATLELIDKNGKPITNAEVVIEQQTHEFLFGCNLFVLGQLKTPELNSKYEKAFTNLFNFATVPFYWGDLEPEQGNPRFEEGSKYIWRRPPPDRLLKWCEANNITPKGHALMYLKSKFMPDWTASDNPTELMKQVQKHMVEIADRYGDRFPVWDAINEEIPRMNRPEEWPKLPDDFFAWGFHEAGKLFPENVNLTYNDGTYQVHRNDTDKFIELVQSLINKGIRIDGMGIQFHMYNRPGMLKGEILPPNQLLEVYEKLEQLDLPIFITEITISGKGENGSMEQAKIVENLYRLWFSTPNMAGLTWWNLGDGLAFGKENSAMGGLCDQNLDPKPAYDVLDKLINHEWQTNQTLNTDIKGKIDFRGFYGKYKVLVKYKDKEYAQEINVSSSVKNNFKIEL